MDHSNFRCLRTFSGSPRDVEDHQTSGILVGIDGTETSKIHALEGLANRLGLTPPPPPPLLPPIDLSDIHLVCWTAIYPATSDSESDKPATAI